MSQERGKRRIFMWIFLAIQVLFVLWIIGGLMTTVTSDAGEVGKAIGIGIVGVIWVAVDALLAIGRYVVLSSRGQHRTRETT